MKKERRTVKNNQLYIVTQTAQDVSERERERKEKKKERREKENYGCQLHSSVIMTSFAAVTNAYTLRQQKCKKFNYIYRFDELVDTSK